MQHPRADANDGGQAQRPGQQGHVGSGPPLRRAEAQDPGTLQGENVRWHQVVGQDDGGNRGDGIRARADAQEDAQEAAGDVPHVRRAGPEILTGHRLQHVHVQAGGVAQGGFGVDPLLFQCGPHPGQQFGVFQHEHLGLEDGGGVAAQVFFGLKGHLRQLGPGGLHGVLESLPFRAGVLCRAAVKPEVGPAEQEGRADGDAPRRSDAAQGLAGGAVVGWVAHCHHLRGGETPPASIGAGGVSRMSVDSQRIILRVGLVSKFGPVRLWMDVPP